MTLYYYRIFGEEIGPISLDVLKREIARGELSSGHEVRSTDDTNWSRVGDLIEQGIVSQSTVPLPSDTNASAIIGSDNVASEKSSSDKPETGIMDVPDPQWYVRMGKVERGPINFQKLTDIAKSGHILPTDKVRKSDETEWTMAGQIAGLFSSKFGLSHGGSPAVQLKPRPSLVPLFESVQRASSVQSGQNQPDMPASAQPPAEAPSLFTSSAPTDSDAPQSVLIAEPGQSNVILPPKMINSVEFEKLPSSQIVEDEVEIPQRQVKDKGLVELGRGTQPTIHGPASQNDAQSKHKLRRGQFKELQLNDRPSLLIVGFLCLVALLLIAWSQMPVSILRFEGPYRELAAIYDSLHEKWTQQPNDEFWKFTKKEVVYKIESSKRKVTNLNSLAQIRATLLYAADCLAWASRASSRDEVNMFMDQARLSLERARQDLDEASLPQK